MIHRVRIQNFKSIIDVTVDLSPVTVLVGKSGTGKSNFVHALRLLRDVLAIRQNKALQDHFDQSRPAFNLDASRLFEITFSVPGIQEFFSYQIVFRPHGPTTMPILERLSLGRKDLFFQAADEQNQQVKWLVEPELLPVPVPGPTALSRIPSISEVVIAFTALTSGFGFYAFSDHVLSGENKPSFSIGLDEGAANYIDALKNIISNLQDLSVRKSMISSLQCINSTVSAVELNDLLQPTHIVVGHKLNGKTMTLGLSQESEGFRRFYAHLLALYQRPPKQTLIFEHPEDGIHPGALSLLAEEFKSAPEDGRGQVILATHSPKLLDEFDAEQIRVVELDGLATKIGHVSEEQMEAISEKLLDPGELLTVDPARIKQEATAQ